MNKPQGEQALTGAEKAQRWRDRHPVKAKQVRTESRVRKRIWLSEYKRREGCSGCGITDPRVLDFHHVNSEEKTLAVSALVSRSSWEVVQAEIEKCVILCANCHRIEEAQIAVAA